jgi:hypothetical protein
MSFLFGNDTPAPQPAPVPVSPSAPNNEEAQRQRQAAEDAALADTKSRGRRATMAAGMEIAADEQGAKGLLASKRRAASRELSK